MGEDASATYRGFRNQALYTLHRLLTDTNSDERIYRPEGNEDLAIFDSRMHLVEAIQVKDYSAPLSLSALKPKSDTGFFARLMRRKVEHPSCTTKLASFGTLGPELEAAIYNRTDHPAQHRSEVVRKLCEGNTTISTVDAIAMLDGLRGNVVHPIKSKIVSEVVEALQGTTVIGDVAHSVELLMYWIFDAAEHQRDLTKQALLLQVERIGRYLASLRDNSSEWEVSISAIKSLELSPDEITRLTVEYRRGIQARWDHIVAGADCMRTHRINDIHNKFQLHSVVIIRGASGQGKSTLGWRYIHDYCAEGVRFYVKLVQGREHAMRISNALAGHVQRLHLRAVAYLDVSPADTGWTELVRELAAAGLKVIVAIREEDFRRANMAISDFDYSEIVLDRVTEGEARAIFSVLHADALTSSLDFEEAWARFDSAEGGPLLEFTHLVSEGETLTSRIASQIHRLKGDAERNVNGLSPAHLELLALASVANEAGARVSLIHLCELSGLSPLTGPLRILENEFMLRVQYEKGETLVAGLHALRSKAIANAMFSEMPELRQPYTIKAVSLIIDEDIESFLLAAFSRLQDNCDALLQRICSLKPRSWVHAAGITEALIWQGVSDYENRNRATILEAITSFQNGWWMSFDSFVGSDEEAAEALFECVRALRKDFQPFKISPKTEVFELFKLWASDAPAPAPPQTPEEWVGVGDVAFWLGHIKNTGPMNVAIEALLPHPLPDNLNIDELSRFVSGRSQLADASFMDWHAIESPALIGRYVVATDSAHVTDDGSEVKVYFSVQIVDSAIEDTPEKYDWNEQAMKRVRLLRLLFPNHKVFASQGLGVELLTQQLRHDPTVKAIPAKSLPMERSARLNAMFHSLVCYRHSRPDSWREYATEAITFREAVSTCFRKLYRALEKVMSESSPKKTISQQLPTKELISLDSLSKLPMFPRSAVDEWGFLSEERIGIGHEGETLRAKSLQRFRTWKRIFNDYQFYVNLVAKNSEHYVALYIAGQKGYVTTDEDNKTRHLFLANLGSAWELLQTMQTEFRVRFGHLFSKPTLDDLDAYETSNYRHLWSVSVAMRYEQHRHSPSIVKTMEVSVAMRRAAFLESLADELNRALGEDGTAVVQTTPWNVDGSSFLCVTIDCDSIEAIEANKERAAEGIWRAAQTGQWRMLEWIPLEIEWSKVALVHLVGGKCLLPAWTEFPIASFFMMSDAFDAEQVTGTTRPLSAELFEEHGVGLWKSPLLRAALVLQDSVRAFSITNFRYSNIAQLIVEHGLAQNEVDRILVRFSRELKIVLTEAQQRFSETTRILETLSSRKTENWKSELRRLCDTLLFNTDEDSSVFIDLEGFNAWLEQFPDADRGFQELILEIVTYVLTDRG